MMTCDNDHWKQIPATPITQYSYSILRQSYRVEINTSTQPLYHQSSTTLEYEVVLKYSIGNWHDPFPYLVH